MPLVYLAGSLEQQEFLLRVKSTLSEHGVLVTSRWLTAPKLDRKAEPTAEDEVGMLKLALDAIEDIRNADAVVLWVDGDERGQGGRHWEVGHAWTKGKPIIVVGPRTNIFHRLPGVWTLIATDNMSENARLVAQLVHELKRAYDEVTGWKKVTDR